MQESKTHAAPRKRLVGVIHLGASSTHLLLAERSADGQMRVVETAQNATPLARDIFGKGRIGGKAIETCVRTLEHYRRILAQYGIDKPSAVRVVGTNILAEAENQDVFVNRIHIACGYDVEPLDDGEMTRLVYLATQRVLAENAEEARKRVIAFHVGPGNTRVLHLEKGNISLYNSYRLGAFRVRESLRAFRPSPEQLRSLVHEQIRGAIEGIHHDFRDKQADQVIVIGTEMQTLAEHLEDAKDRGFVYAMRTEELRTYVDRLTGEGLDHIVRRFGIDYPTAEALVPGLETNLSLAEKFGFSEILVPKTAFEAGLLEDLASSDPAHKLFHREVVQSAMSIGEKYRYDSGHALHVTGLCGQLFQVLKPMHVLDDHYELLLRVAAILHEVGAFISSRSHHKHSYYLILNSEVFGLGRDDAMMVALVARYHRRATPRPTHAGYLDLRRDKRMIVAKLAAILRVADSLDRSHTQRVSGIAARIEGDTLIIGASGAKDLAIEQMAMNRKSDLFRQIYGLKVRLHAEAPRPAAAE